MPMENQQEQKLTWDEKAAAGFGLMYLTLSAHRLAIMPFIRSGFGVSAFHPQGLFTFGTLLFLATGIGGFRLYFLCWIVVMAARRLETFGLWWKGVRYHSKYQGFPYAAMLMPRVKSEQAAFYAEPVMCLFVGLLIATISKPVGLFVMGGFVSFAGVMVLDAVIDERRMQGMYNAAAEMRYLLERFRREGDGSGGQN